MSIYKPGVPPADLEGLVVFLNEELLKIQQALVLNGAGNYDVLSVPPKKFVPGTVIYADGTNLETDRGEGLYRYSLGGTWEYVG